MALIADVRLSNLKCILSTYCWLKGLRFGTTLIPQSDFGLTKMLDINSSKSAAQQVQGDGTKAWSGLSINSTW